MPRLTHPLVVTRDEFMDLIETALSDSGLEGAEAVKLRAFGVSGTEAAVGTYSGGCPLNQACGVDGSGVHMPRKLEDFAYAYDDAVRDLAQSDRGVDVPDCPDGVVVK